MRASLALWALLAAVLPSCEAAVKADAANVVGAVRRNGLLRQSALIASNVEAATTIAGRLDAALRARGDVAKFGPGNCISTWKNADGHCEVETQCKEHDISKYAVKFICIDDGGEKVRHVFAMGSFDPQEQFDTLIECKKCLAEKEEKIEVIAEGSAQTSHGKQEKSKEEEGEKAADEEMGGSPLTELRDEVKQLEVFMMNTSAELQKLNAKVYSDGYKPPAVKKACVDCDKVGQAAAAKAVEVSSLVHHGTSHRSIDGVEAPSLREEAEAIRVKKLHRKHIEDDDDEPDRPVRKLVTGKVDAKTDTAPSLASALRKAEERDEKVQPAQPSKAHMEMSKSVGALKVQKPKPLVVALPPKPQAEEIEIKGSDDESDGDGQDQSAYEPQHQEEPDNERPTLATLQQDDDVVSGEDSSADNADDEDGGDDSD